jgi:threonine synthase
VDCDLWFKDETGLPTGTFKDRGSAVGVGWAIQHDLSRLATVSHGNMARSMAAMAAAADRECVVLVPADIPVERLSPISVYGSTVIQVDGAYGDLYERSIELEESIDGLFVNSDDPLRVAGQKTVAYEIIDQFRPDAIVLPVSSGGNASAVWKGLRELKRMGHLDDLPRMYLVQAEACSPIADAYCSNAAAVSPSDSGETVAYSIANRDPPSGNRALEAARETGGAVIAVTDSAILDAQDRLARDGGVRVEPAGATPLAGVESLAESGAITPEETVVLVLTGTGLTEQTTTASEVPTVALDALPQRLPELVTTSGEP